MFCPCCKYEIREGTSSSSRPPQTLALPKPTAISCTGRAWSLYGEHSSRSDTSAPRFSRCFTNKLYSKVEDSWNFPKSQNLYIGGVIEIFSSPSAYIEAQRSEFFCSQVTYIGGELGIGRGSITGSKDMKHVTNMKKYVKI